VNSDLLLPGCRRLPAVCPSKMRLKTLPYANPRGGTGNWRYFRSTSINGHRKTGSTGPFRARNGLQQISGHQNSLSVVQLVEQRLGFLQIECVEAFGEPVVDRREKIVGLVPLPLITHEARQARRRAQLPGLCLLRPRYR